MSDERKTYYVSVGAGQVLEDKAAAPFEFEIRANEEELNKLQELFEETSSADEAAAFHFVRPVTNYGLKEMNDDYSRQMHEIYKWLYHLGTEETKRHIESIDILDPEDLQSEAKPH